VEGRPLDEAELVERARKGDTGAYEELVRMHQAGAHRAAFVVAGDAADAEDAAQSAFIKAFYALDRFRGDAPFRPWLLRIVTNEALNRRRSSARRRAVAERLAKGRPRVDAAPSPEDAALSTERSRAVLAALGRLRDRDRLLISYRYFLGLTEAEMAETLGVPRGTIKSRLSRAMDRLRKVVMADPALVEGVDRG
jgi:RNA polymerase sigma factor (sigma-70 family)